MAVIVDLNLVCIICLQDDGGGLVSVYSDATAGTKAQDAESQVTLAEKIALCSSLNLADINIKLSNQICANCLNDLAAAWRFRKNCETFSSLYQSIQKEELEDVGSLVNYEISSEKVNEQATKLSLRYNAEAKSHTKLEENEAVISENDQENIQDNLEESYSIVEYVDEDEQKDTDYFDCMRDGMLEEVDDNYDGAENADSIKRSSQQNNNTPRGIKREMSEEFNEEEIEYLKDQLSNDTFTTNKNAAGSEYSLGDEAALEEETNGKENSKTSLHSNIGDELIEESSTKAIAGSSTQKSSNIKSTVTKKSTTKRGKSVQGSSAKICEVCGNNYKYQHALLAHMRRHNNDRQFACELCEKAFVSNVELRRHMRVHTGDKPYSCSYCDRRFSDFGSCRKHERTHTGERPYKCPSCDKSFAYPHVLTVHLRTHTGEKKFQCTRCGRGFTKKAYLLTHLENHARCENISLIIDGSTKLEMDDTIHEQQQEITAIKTVALEESIFTTTDIITDHHGAITDKLQNIIVVEQDSNYPCIIELEEAIDEEHLEEENNEDEYILGMRS